MPEYVGLLLDSLSESDVVTEPEDIPPCGGGWQHSNAISSTVLSIVGHSRITLTRRIRSASYEELPGEITGQVMGMSSHSDGRIMLALALDDGRTVAVNVTYPGDWHWQVDGCG